MLRHTVEPLACSSTVGSKPASRQAPTGVVEAGRHVARPDLEALLRELGDRQAVASGEAVLLAQRDNEGLAAQLHTLDVRSHRGAGTRRDVVAALQKQALDVAAEDLTQLDLQRRMALRESVDDRGQRAVDGRQRVGDAHHPVLAPLGCLRTRHDTVGGVENAARLLREHHTRWRELDPVAGTHEQPHAEQVLDNLDLLGERLLGDVQALCGAGEAA